MQDIEPYFNWRHLYTAETDELSPFYGREYSEFMYTDAVYNYLIHPQWDYFGSKTLYLKLLFADYEVGFAIIELIGEWNDAIEDDIMTLKRDFIDQLQANGIHKFILIGENVLNFHSGDIDYYEEWRDEVVEFEGWIVLLNLPSASKYEFEEQRLQRYVDLMEIDNWRVYTPDNLFLLIENKMSARLGM